MVRITGANGFNCGEVPRTANGGLDWAEFHAGIEGSCEPPAQTELLGRRERFLADRELIASRIKVLANVLLEALEPTPEERKKRLNALSEIFQRLQLEIALTRRWHIPYCVIYQIALRCPKRWLLRLKPEWWK